MASAITHFLFSFFFYHYCHTSLGILCLLPEKLLMQPYLNAFAETGSPRQLRFLPAPCTHMHLRDQITCYLFVKPFAIFLIITLYFLLWKSIVFGLFKNRNHYSLPCIMPFMCLQRVHRLFQGIPALYFFVSPEPNVLSDSNRYLVNIWWMYLYTSE